MSLTKIDWLGFRTQGEVPATLEALRGVFGSLGSSVQAKFRKRGWMGYEQAADLCLADMHVGLVAFGGESQKGWISVNLSGRGCEWIKDWEEANYSLSALPAYENRRVDIALDTFKREVTHDTVVEAYRSGLFTTGGAGRPPKMNQILPEDPQDGRTIYIGQRDQGKFLRAYEKGYEMVKDVRKGGLEFSFVNGIPIGDIFRLELELKPKNCPLPADLIGRRDEYFSGAYPYLQKVVEVEPEIFRQSREKGPQRDMEAALAQIRHQYGTTLFTALMAHSGDVGVVWEKIVGKKHNEALLAKGVLLCDHE
jgi:phage replication initiation protein